MALSVKKGSFSANTSTGNQAVTGVGFTPLAVIFWGQLLTATGFGTGRSFFFGCATSSTQRWALASASDDAVATSNAGRYLDVASCIRILSNGTPTTDAIADLVSLDADGFTINWSDAPGSAWIVHYLALGGSSITNAKAGNFTPSSGTGSKATTDPGFRPDFLLLSGIANGSGANKVHGNFGIGMASSTTARGSYSFKDKDAQGTSDVGSAQGSAAIHRVITTSATVVTFDESDDLASFDATGFTITRTTSGVQPICYLALKGGNYFVGAETQKTTTGTKATTGVGFKPAGLFALSWGLASSASADATSALLTVGATDGSVDGHTWFQDKDNVATEDEDQKSDTSKVLSFNAQPSTVSAEASTSSLDSDGFTLNWTTADGTAREFIYAAFGPAAAGGGGGASARFRPLLGVGS